MQQKLTRNTFTKGRNTDQDRNKISPDQYMEAHNLELVGDGTFYSLKNIKGTVNVQDIIGGDPSLVNSCMGVFRTDWLIDDVSKPCLTIFTLSTSLLFKIWCFDINGSTIYEVYQESVDSDYDTSDRVIDVKSYAENGKDILYITDNYHEVRILNCQIIFPYAANFLSDFDLSLQRRGGLGSVSFDSMISGSLLSGTYQFAYRCLNPSTKTITKWSSLTSPIHAYSTNDVSDIVFSGVGLPTPFGIQVTVNLPTEEAANFEYYQLAVVENIYPVDITTVVSLLPLTPIASTTYSYKSNSKIGTIPIDELVVDLAQIQTVKTLNIKQNRLFGANVTYSNLEFDNGNPAISSGSILSATNGTNNPYSNQVFSTRNLGYFRDEVYRFGVVYSDKYGNRSPAIALDMSVVSGNLISGAIDMKFPARSYSPTYSLFNSSGEIQSLGVQLSGITNHPTWATKVEVVRVKRIKNIKFQTPVIPMVTVKGIGALDNYPTQSTSTAFPDASPQTASSQLVPKNLFWPDMRSIVKNTTTFSGGIGKIGEAKYFNSDNYSFAKVYPQSTLYGDTSFSFTGAEKISFIDYVLLKAQITDSNSSVVAGDDVNTTITGTFHALGYNQYYFDPLTVKSLSGSSANIEISAYEFMPNLSEGTELSGTSVEKYSLLQTAGIDIGVAPTVSASGIISMNLIVTETPSATSLSFLAGTFHPRTSGGYIVDASGPTYSATGAYNSNDYINEYPGYLNNSSYVGIAGIANITIGLGDDRYGDPETAHEYISTGASYSFSPTEIATLQAGGSVPVTLDVWGGDCFVGAQTFKVSDSSYSLVNAQKWYTAAPTDAQLKDKWGEVFNNSNGHIISMPVSVQNAAQFIQVIIESEYNGFVRDIDVLVTSSSASGIPILGVGNSALRSPLTYRYNLNLSKQNDQKIYLPAPQFIPIQDRFKARIVFSDLKIYNSSEQGFDVFRVLNYFDLEEKRGAIIKLALAGDNLYALQERGTVYLPTGSAQLEQTDAGIISVGTSDVISRPIIVDSERGTQHLRSVVETGNLAIFPDNINKSVYILEGQTLVNISEKTENNTIFRTIFADIIPEKNIIGIYDPVRMEYWMVDNLNYTCQVFNEKYGFIGDYEFSANSNLEGGSYTNQKLYLIGKGTNDSDKLAVHEMYTGPNNSLMGEIVVPRVVVSVNPDEDISKVFDNLMLSATDRLDEADLDVTRESSLGNQAVTVGLDEESIEGNFRVKVPLDSSKSRLRGLRMTATIKWGELTSALSSLYTKYRLSKKTPF